MLGSFCLMEVLLLASVPNWIRNRHRKGYAHPVAHHDVRIKAVLQKSRISILSPVSPESKINTWLLGGSVDGLAVRQRKWQSPEAQYEQEPMSLHGFKVGPQD